MTDTTEATTPTVPETPASDKATEVAVAKAVSFRQGCVNSEQPSGNVGAPRTWRAGCCAGAGAGSVQEGRPAGGGRGAVAWLGAGGSKDVAGRVGNQSGAESVASAARRAKAVV